MSEPERDTPVEQKKWVEPLIKVAGFLLVLGGLPFFFAVGPTLLKVRDGLAWTEAPWLFLLIVVLIGMPLALAGGVGLLKGSDWSHGLARLAALVPTLGGAINMATDPSWELALLVSIFAVPGLILFAGLSVHDVRAALGADANESVGASLKKIGRSVVILLLGMIVIGLTLSEMPEIVRDVRMSRWQSQCEETGEIEPCGFYGSGLVRWGESDEDWRGGLDQIEKLCKRGDSFSCRRYAYLLSYTDTSQLKASAEKIIKRLNSVVRKKCLEGDGRACFVLKSRLAPPSTMISNRDEVVAKSVELCREGDIWACRAVYEFLYIQAGEQRPVEVDDEQFAVQKLCENGFSLGCTALDFEDEKSRALMSEICDDKPAAAFCAKLAQTDEAGHELHRRYCLEGGLSSCRDAIEEVSEDQPHRPVIVATYEAMDEKNRLNERGLHYDFGYWGLEPIAVETTDIRAACDDDVAEACFALGIELSKDRRGELTPALGKLADYDRTFMKACRLGMNAGCFAYAERIMNRPIGERRRVDRANEALELACERGNQLACWYVDIDDELIKGVPSDYEALLQRGCRAQDYVSQKRGACRELAYFWAYEFGGTPWLFSERRSRALVRRHCDESNGKWSCAMLAWTRGNSSSYVGYSASPPWHIEYFTAAKKSCKVRNLWSCEQMLSIARDYPAVRLDTLNELRSGVCEVLPEVESCEKNE